MSTAIAQTILAQIGGGKFVAMTGAKNLVAGQDYLSFRIPRSMDGVNYVKIKLTLMDMYDMEFGKIRGVNYSVIKTVSMVYNSQLGECFENVTGLRISL
jgi:hypothetical protein